MSQQLRRLKFYALALGINSTSVIGKADEFCRILDAKGQANLKQLNFVGEAKLILCLDIASSEHGQSFDKKLSIERSGMAKKSYLAARRSMESLLSLQKNMTVRECAVTLGHPQLSDAASVIVKMYLRTHLGNDTSLVTSTVNMAALAIVARKQSINLKISKLMDMAACNKSSFDKIKSLMEGLERPESLLKTRTVEDSNKGVRVSPRKRKANVAADGLNPVIPKISKFVPDRLTADQWSVPSDADSFEVWKRKLITVARERLKTIP